MLRTPKSEKKNVNHNHIVATAFEEGVRNEKTGSTDKKNPSNPQNLSRDQLLCVLEEKGAGAPSFLYNF